MEQKNTVQAVNPTSSYGKLPKDRKLDDVMCFEYTRKINRDQTIQWENKKYLIEPKGNCDYKDYIAVIRRTLCGCVKFFVMGAEVTVEEVCKTPPMPVYEKVKTTDLQRAYCHLYAYMSPFIAEIWNHKVTGKPIDFTVLKNNTTQSPICSPCNII